VNKDPEIRPAFINDLNSIVDIYNQAIRSKSATGDMDEFKIEDRLEWFKKFDPNTFPIYVAELNKKIIGYATLSPYRQGRKAMNKIAEISFYIDYSYHNLGIGYSLISYIISDCERIGIEALLAILLDINKPSIKLLKKFNFEEWGHLPQIINFDDTKCGHLIYGLIVKNSPK
jgi:phosphinothricin acetyltransferase